MASLFCQLYTIVDEIIVEEINLKVARSSSQRTNAVVSFRKVSSVHITYPTQGSYKTLAYLRMPWDRLHGMPAQCRATLWTIYMHQIACMILEFRWKPEFPEENLTN